jgi:hypothetical protein
MTWKVPQHHRSRRRPGFHQSGDQQSPQNLEIDVPGGSGTEVPTVGPLTRVLPGDSVPNGTRGQAMGRAMFSGIRPASVAYGLGLAAFAVTLSLYAAASASAHFRLYPWCAYYNLPGGPMKCSFSTLEQCRQSISGVGGMCGPNPYSAYDNPAYSFRSSQRPHRGRRSRR